MAQKLTVEQRETRKFDNETPSPEGETDTRYAID